MDSVTSSVEDILVNRVSPIDNSGSISYNYLLIDPYSPELGSVIE